MMRPVRLTGSPSLISLNSPSSTAPTLSSSRLSAMPNTPCGNSSISPAMACSTPCTRAMPSPIEMMLPTSATSTSTAKLPICSRMILEISSALMSIFSDPVGAGARPGLSSFCQSLLHPLELRRDAAVVDRVAEASHHATDQRWIRSHAEAHGTAGRLRQPTLDRLRSIGPNRRRGRHLRAHDLLVIENALAIRGEEVRQKHEPVALGEQDEELGQNRRQPRPLNQNDHHGAFALHRHGRMQHDLLEQRILFEEVHECGQLVANRVERRAFLDGDVEKRASVAVGGRLVRHLSNR